MRTTYLVMLLLWSLHAIAQTEIKNQYVVMSDQDSLATDIYLPAEEGTYPVILMRTPYDKSQRKYGSYFNKRGYIFIVQDVRGRVRSSGRFKAWIDEAMDGQETVNWIVKQPWSNGKVGLIGSSYSGYAAMQLAGTNHPAIKAIVNNSGPANLYDVVFPGGVFHNTAILPWTMAFTNNKAFNFPPYASGLSLNQLAQQKPLNDAFVKNEYQGVFWDYLVNHQTEDYYWQQVNASNLALSDVPVLHITSWFDFIASSAIDGYREMVNGQMKRNASHNQEMIIGPWIHDDMMNGRTAVGEVDYGEKVKYGLNKFLDLATDYFDVHIKEEARSGVNKVPFKYFELGTEEWIESSAWPETSVQSLYLSQPKANRTLTNKASKKAFKDSYQFDPENPVQTLGGANIHFPFFGPTNGLRTQNELEKHSDLLIYKGEVLKKDLQIFGKIKASLFVSTDAQDADITVKLNQIDPEGKVTNIRDGIQRLSFVKNRAQRKFIVPGEVTEIAIDLGYMAITIPRGHRLSIQVASSNYPKFSLNPGTTEDALLTGDFKSSTQTIHVSADHPSRILIPVRK